MSNNIYAKFLGLIPSKPLQIGVIVGLTADGCTVRLPTGEAVKVRGAGQVGQPVFFRDGVIEGQAPNLQVVEINV